MEILCAQNDYPSSYQIRIDSSYFYPSTKKVLASCTTCLCLCKSLKELFLLALIEWRSRKRVQRYDFFCYHQNFSRLFSRKIRLFLSVLIKINHKNLYTF